MSKKKILIVDDEEHIVLLLTRMLGDKFEIVSASNGKKAVEAVHEHNPDLVMMDLMMPEMDGYTACSLIKGDPATRGIPVVMITGVGYELNRELAMRVGVNGYLTKPFSLTDIRKIIDSLITES